MVYKGKWLDCTLDNPNNVTVRPVDRPKDPMIHVRLPDTSWLAPKRHHKSTINNCVVNPSILCISTYIIYFFKKTNTGSSVTIA